MRAREITISGAPVFTFELSLLRVSARHPRAVRETELVRICRGKSVMAPVHGCHSQRDRLLRSSKVHQRRHLRITSPWCLPLECATGRRTSCVDHWPKTPNAIIPILSKTHIPRVVASRINFLSTELTPSTPFPLWSILRKV